MHSGFTALRNTCGMNCGVRVKLNAHPEALKKDLARIGELFTEGLDRFGGPFLAGAGFGAVDASSARWPIACSRTGWSSLPPRWPT
jgi:glutathione S-transferase